MEQENPNPSNTPLIIAIVSLVLAVIALGVAVALASPILRKSYSAIPTTSLLK